jgi:hypothetical protein
MMSQESFVFFMGIGVLLLPFLGVPNDIKKWIFLSFGILIAIVGYRLRRAAYLRSIETLGGERRAEAFVENQAPGVLDPKRS